MAVLKYKDSNGQWQTLPNVMVNQINVVQTTGTSTTDVMSQSAVTENLHSHTNKTYLDGISGNVGTMAYENTSSYSSATEVNTALSNKADKTAVDDLSGQSETIAAALTDLDKKKLDASAYTPTDLSNYYTKSETSGATEISNALGGKVNSAAYTAHTADTTIHFTTGTVQTQINNSISGKVNISDFNTYSGGVATTISSKSDKTATVSNVLYNNTTGKLQQTINGTTTDVVSLAPAYYATCTTAGNVAAKTVTIEGLILGSQLISILFTDGFTVSSPTLNINNTGAKPIKLYGNAIPMGKVDNNTIISMICDGTNYNVISIESQAVPTSNAVDLGLPSGLLWCDHNVGASKPEEEGFFFSWGNVSGHCLNGVTDYDFGTSNTTEPYISSSGATLTGNIAVGDAYDMARANMGAPWRLPTNTEFQELYNNCTNVWINQNGINGRRFTSNINGNSIFFPAAGNCNGSSHNVGGYNGYYWSSSFGNAARAYHLYFGSAAVYPQYNLNRYLGFSVRAVQ